MLRVWGVLGRARPVTTIRSVIRTLVEFVRRRHPCLCYITSYYYGTGVTYMAGKRSAAHESVRVYRAKMKQQGFRQISIWVPDTKSPKFRKECRRQSRLASAADQSAQLHDLLNFAAGSVEGWT